MNTLKLNFLKRILLDTVNKEISDNFFITKNFPSYEVMNSAIHLPLSQDRLNGMDWPEKAHTMIGLKRLNNLHDCLDLIRQNNIQGDFIETGVWRGGACIFMQIYNDLYCMNRKVFVADSFRGLPPPESHYIADAGDIHYTYAQLAVSRKEVEKNFELYGALKDNVIFLEGWFKNTLNNRAIEKLSILRLDGDMYGSTIESLSALYKKLQKGGALIIDDFALKGCKNAVLDFRRFHNIETKIQNIDSLSAFWIKE